MSKRALKKYLNSLEKEQLEEQIIDLYERFKEVNVFYNFVFNPKEDKLVREAKFKISKEYFPPNRKKAKARRSIAQKQIKHFLELGVEPHATADVMLFNIEIAQAYTSDREKITEAFTKSIFKSFEQAMEHIYQNGITSEFIERMLKISKEAEAQEWPNSYKFRKITVQFE